MTFSKFLPPANEVREGNVFTPVCQSFCSQGGVWLWVQRGASRSRGCTSPGHIPPGHTSSWLHPHRHTHTPVTHLPDHTPLVTPPGHTHTLNTPWIHTHHKHPLDTHSLWTHTPGHFPRTHTHPLEHPTPQLRSTSGRYQSYWHVFLFIYL